MINKLEKIYPHFMLLKEKRNKLYDIKTNKLVTKELLEKNNYIIIRKASYEVHKR